MKNIEITCLSALSSYGEISATISHCDLLDKKAKRILENESIEPDNMLDLHYNANFHPASQDIRLNVEWQEKGDKKIHRRSFSISTQDQKNLIEAMEMGCEKSYGCTMSEFMNTAKKQQERELLDSLMHN